MEDELGRAEQGRQEEEKRNKSSKSDTVYKDWPLYVYCM